MAIHVSPEDRFAVQDLFARYSWAYDCGNIEGYAELFVPDGVIEAMDGTRHRGRDAIRKFVASFAHQPGFAGTQHHTGQLVFEEGSAALCTVRCYWLSLHWKHATGEKIIKSMGYYVSRCQKVQGEWLFAERVIRYWDAVSLPWEGPPSPS